MKLKIAAMSLMMVTLTAGVSLAANLPLTRVVLFSSGVGYFEREGTVEGNAQFEMSFRTEQINDILKSLVLQDLGGGTIAPVTYAPQDPLDRTLSAFEVNLSDNPSLARIWDRLRGAKVRVTAERTVEGVVLGAEKQEKAVDRAVIKFDVLNLMTEQGLVGIPLVQVAAIKVLDPKVEADLAKALEAIDRARDINKRPVTLSFRGQGKRTVRVGYLLETPVWKTSYRLVLSKTEPFLEGWAIVENTTDDDWSEVSLSMVSGRPVSFIQDLYQPLYVTRPTVPVSVAAAAAPRVYEGAMEERVGEARAADGMGGGGGARPMAKTAARRGVAAHMPAGAMLAEGAAPAAPELALATAGAKSMAVGGKVGTLFQYVINQPVTVPRQRSAMIPILGEKVQAWKLSVYNQGADPKHPMSGVLLKNTSKLHLMAGPITVFDGNVYGGDALIEDVAPGEQRLLTYAMDLEMEVDPKTESAPEELVGVKIVHGVMTVSNKERVTTTYTAKNSSDEKRVLLIEHPLDADWKLVAPEKPQETTRNAYRFRLEIEPGQTAKLVVTLEHVKGEEASVAEADTDALGLLLKARQLSPQVKAALQKLVDLRGEAADLKRQRELKETRIKEIEQEQERIRKNMEQLDRQSQLYKDYVEKLATQEKEFETLQADVAKLQEQETAKAKQISDYVAGLSVE